MGAIRGRYVMWREIGPCADSVDGGWTNGRCFARREESANGDSPGVWAVWGGCDHPWSVTIPDCGLPPVVTLPRNGHRGMARRALTRRAEAGLRSIYTRTLKVR